MAKKGESKSQKRLSSQKVRSLLRKEKKWTVKSRPGPYGKKTAIPLGLLARDLIGFGDSMKEVKIALNERAVRVNGVVRTDYRFNIGLFDVVDVEVSKKRYRIVLTRKGSIIAMEVPLKGNPFKLCKVTGKKVLKKGLMQITTNDGTVLRIEKEKLNVGDSIKLGLPEKKIEAVYEMKKGNKAYITGGRHTAELATIKEIIQGTVNRPKLVVLEGKEESFKTIAENVYVVGEKKPEIELGEGKK